MQCSVVLRIQQHLYSSFFVHPMLVVQCISWIFTKIFVLFQVVEHIFFKFSSAEYYVHLYSALLLEETRSLLCSDIQNIADAQFCKLLAVKPCDSPYIEFINCYYEGKNFDICLFNTTSSKDSYFKVESCCLDITTEIGRGTFLSKELQSFSCSYWSFSIRVFMCVCNNWLLKN
jgi:hypothetical protein